MAIFDALRRDLWTVAIMAPSAAAGAGLAVLLGLPAPYLTGPAIIVTILSQTGLIGAPPVWLRNLCFVLIGIGMGSGITPEALRAAAQWPVPLVALAVALVVLTFSGAAALERFFRFDRPAARLAATPGHLSFVIAFAEDLRSDVARVSVVQALRVLYLTLLVPFAVQWATGADLSFVAADGAPMTARSLAVLTVLSLAIGALFLRLNVPAALLLAGLAVSGVTHGLGWIEGAMPAVIANPTFAIMGALIGSRFVGITPHQILSASAASLVLTGLALATTFGAVEIVHGVTGLPRLDLLIAFAPGGLETMAALSLMLDTDPAFVAIHHLARLIFLSFLVPLILPRPSRPEPTPRPRNPD
ncbi:MAG: AbrB family transcriptional regulator [Pseudomonadota bacterium]